MSQRCIYRNQRWRGDSVLVFDPRHITGFEQLTEAKANAFSADFHRAATAITMACNSDLMNYELLGNGIPHRHWHVLPRYRNDPYDVC